MLERYQSENRTRPIINYFNDGLKFHGEVSNSDAEIQKETRIEDGLCMNLNCRQNSLLDPLKAMKGSVFCKECDER